MGLSINIEDFDKMCRICLQLPETFIPISLHDTINMLKACASVDISEDDELPNQICHTCLNRLQDSYNFQNLCKKSDYDLRRVIAEHKKNKQNKNVEDCDDKMFLLKDQVVNLDDDLKDYNLETLSIKSEDLPADNETENSYNDETFSLKNEETLTDDEKRDENTDRFIQEEKVSLPEKTKNQTNQKSKARTKRKKRFICEKCDRKFDTPQSLGWHCKTTHKVKGTKCSYCNVICCHPLHLKVHEESHTNSTIKCEQCGKEFATKTFLHSHIYTHSTDRPFKCPQCNSAFKTKYVLNNHIKAVHAVEKQPAKLATCHVCGKTVKRGKMKKHLQIHTERKRVDCPKCGKKFISKDTLRNHNRIFHVKTIREYTHLCSVCGLGAKSVAELERHMLTHTGEKPFQCDKCEMRYRTSDALKTHVRNVHLNIRDHVCSVCSQAFHDKRVLANHMRRHTGERPFACFICGKKFAAKVSVYIHLKQVHKVEKKSADVVKSY